MDITVEQVILFANIFFVFIIVLCGLIGFIRGTLKSSYYMIITIVLLSFGWILMAPLSHKIAYFDISSLNLVVDGILVESPMQLIISVIERDFSEYAFLVAEGSYSLSLLESVVGVATKLVYFIVLIISLFTVFHLLFGIIWLIMKKPLRKAFSKESEINLSSKKSFKSRLGGLTIGLTKGLIYTLLIGILFAGVSTISNSVENVINQSEEIVIVCEEDAFTVVQLENNGEGASNDSEYQFIFDLLDSYHETIPHKVFGTFKYGDDSTSFDEALFDVIFSIETNSGNLNLRKEIKKIEKILTSDAIREVMTEGFDIKKLYALSDEDLKEIVDTLSSLDLVKIVVPVGIEFVINSDMLVEKFGESFKEIQKLIKENYDKLIDLDYSSDIKNLGYIFVDVLDLLGENIGDLSKVDFLNLDLVIINQIFGNIDKLELLEVVAPVVVNYLLNLDAVKQALEKAGFTMEDLGLTSDIDYINEMMCIESIYAKLKELNIKMVEGKIDLSNVEYDKINEFVDSLFESSIIKNALPVVAATLISKYLPDEFSNIVTKEEVQNINWEKEFAPLLNAAAVLLKNDILDSSNKVETIKNLDDSAINELGLYLSQSELFVNNFDQLIIELLKVILGDEIEYNTLDPNVGEIWSETEIIAIFKVFKKLSNGLSSDMSDSEIEELSNAISSSKFIKKNLNNIISAIAKELDVDIISLNNEDWNDDEIFATLKGMCILMDKSEGSNSAVDAVANLSDDDLNVIMNSKFLSQIFVNAIIKLTDGAVIIPDDLQTYESLKWYGSDGELIRLIKGLKLIFSESNVAVDTINIDELLDNIISCFDNEEDAKKLLSSSILCETLRDNLLKSDLLSNYANVAFVNNNLDINDSKNWYSFDVNNIPELKELWKLMNGINILIGNQKFNEVQTLDINLIISNEQLYPQVDSEYNVTSIKVNELLNSIVIEEVFSSVAQEMFDGNGYLSSVLVLPDDVNWYRKDVSNGEEYDLKLFIEAFIIVQEFFDFKNIKDIVNSGTSIRKLSVSQVSTLSTGMVLSRIFRNNIANLFNAIFTVEFANIINDDTLTLDEKYNLVIWWENNMFNQAEYDNVTKSVARNTLIARICEVCEELNG